FRRRSRMSAASKRVTPEGKGVRFVVGLVTSIRRRVSKRLGSGFLVSGMLVVLGATVAVAQIPDSGGVIHGCYTKSTGTIRIIDASVTSCKQGETAISWYQTGPVGPQGPKGDTG